MAISAVDVCNLALSRVGHKQFISSLDEDSQGAECCKVAYQPALDDLLESFDWSFARKHVSLALLSVTRSGWRYAYAYPADCVAVRAIFNSLRQGLQLGVVSTGIQLMSTPGGDMPVPGFGVMPRPAYSIEAADDGNSRLFLTDMASAEVLYTSNAISTATWPQGFVQALVWRVASDAALSLPVKRDLHTNAVAQAERALSRAKARDLRERQDDGWPESSFITGRR